MSNTPIGDHALIGDRHSTGLVDRAGSVEWLAFPRFDSPSVFARLLGNEAGYWQVQPVGEWRSTRRYVENTLVLETTFSTDSGTLVLTDLLAMGRDNGGHRLGMDVPHLLVRRLECTQGAVEVSLDYRPRPEYGLIVPLLATVDGGVTARGGAEWLVISVPFELEVGHGTATGHHHLQAGETVHLGLHRTTLEQTPARVWSQQELAEQVDNTVDAWRSWADMHQSYEGPWADLVHHSGRVLQALSYQPSGAVVAAATTSLPEEVGGERNWDYRYSWVRDASFTMEALWVAACPDEADDYFAFMTTAAASGVGPDRALQIMFGIGGEHDLTERELPHLEGWRDSRPVRVGNEAWSQRQIDVYGELLGAAYRLADQLSDLDDQTKAFLAACADAAAREWNERDQGIWEVRGEAQHFLYSKVMCWVALDRAIALADKIGGEDRVEAWTRTRDEIWQTVVDKGWSESAKSFTQYIGSDDLDASNLMMAIVGFLPADDPRMMATIDATEQRLTDDRGLVFRYRTEGGVDGLAGEEGTFLMCTFWLAEALALSGQPERAREVFERAASFVNDVGLLAEEVDPDTGELLGNFPQAFSHIGLVNAAWAISQAEQLEAQPQPAKHWT
ncbi:MAG: glycoside hydrolase family 15 protein [Actinomycetota bacterium]|nr:glycoside hydrolase family 15 protein [Actinomycetota bacterium]